MKCLGILLILIFASCSGKESNNDPLDFDDFSGRTNVAKRDSLIPDTFLVSEDGTFLGQLISAVGTTYDTVIHKQGHPMDRFSYSTSGKVQFAKKKEAMGGSSTMASAQADFFYYSFEDSNKTINAFYNYLDMLVDEEGGGSVKIKQDLKFIKSPPIFMVVYDTLIVSVIYQCPYENYDRNSFQDSILKIYGTTYKYRIDVDCGGPLRWK